MKNTITILNPSYEILEIVFLIVAAIEGFPDLVSASSHELQRNLGGGVFGGSEAPLQTEEGVRF